MELEQFIEETINEIVTAINISSLKMINDKTGAGVSDFKPIEVSFDIAVTIANSDEKGGKISVLGPWFGGEAGKKLTTIEQNASRIKFSVPIMLKTINKKGPSVL